MKEGKTMSQASHRKFLKTREMNIFRTGYNFPNELILDKEKNTLRIHWFESTDQCTVLFIMSSYCSSCNLDTVEAFVSEYPLFRYVMLYESNEETFHEIKERFNSIQVYKCDTLPIQKQLQFDLFPCAIGINSIGQVVACGLFNDSSHIKKILSPLLRVVYHA
jgi:hypothetical protein